jgi:hexosaminidase
MHCYQPGTSIYYTTDGTEPTERSSVYKTPVYFNNTTTLKMKTFCAGYEPGFTEEASFLKLPYRRTITYQNKYSHLYTAGGDNGLIDGITGDPNSFGSWQGFHATDLDVTIDLESVRNIQTIAASFLQQYPSWIWFPVSVEFQISDDGKEFRSVYSETNKIADNKEGALRETYSCNLPAVRARFVRVIAKNRNVCPPWHPGAGDKAWIFADEIEIK